MIQFYNTLTRKKEAFVPIDEKKVRMYTCGPTVYNYAHIGNYRAYMFEDLLRRFLHYRGYAVQQVMNITDVDDKIIRDANAEGVDFRKFTKPYKDAFFEDLETLRIESAEEYPEATAHVEDMVNLVENLLDKDFAYRTSDGSVYYSVEAFDEYGALANLNPDEMQHAERVRDDEYEKEGIRDFALWKSWKPDDGDIYWETSLGKGRPGWHIECSAMSTRYLGNHFDIHTGGVDNIFPHHENEIAQSKAATGEEFVNYWLHCEHLIVEGQKMSKSLGNFLNLRDVLDRGYSPEAIRYVLLSTHYRQKLNFTWDKLDEAQAAIERLRSVTRRLEQVTKTGALDFDEMIAGSAEGFQAALDDDLNIAGALGHVFSLVKETNTLLDSGEMTRDVAQKVLVQLREFDTILDVLTPSGEASAIPEEILQLVDARQEAREEKNYARADELRDIIEERGYEVEDTPQGPVVKGG